MCTITFIVVCSLIDGLNNPYLRLGLLKWMFLLTQSCSLSKQNVMEASHWSDFPVMLLALLFPETLYLSLGSYLYLWATASLPPLFIDLDTQMKHRSLKEPCCTKNTAACIHSVMRSKTLNKPLLYWDWDQRMGSWMPNYCIEGSVVAMTPKCSLGRKLVQILYLIIYM